MDRKENTSKWNANVTIELQTDNIYSFCWGWILKEGDEAWSSLTTIFTHQDFPLEVFWIKDEMSST